MISRRLALIFCVSVSVAALQAQQKPATASASSTMRTAANQPLDPGETVDGVYRNISFGFTLKLPYGWVDRTDDLRRDSAEASKADPGKSTVLLATFQRPPDAPGDAVNSAIVVAAESVSSYPGLKDASQYFGPIGEIAKAKELSPINQPYDFPIDGMPIVRQDFNKKMGNVTMYQSSMALVEKGYVVSFTFIAGSLDDITDTLDALRFGRVKPPRKQ